MNEVVEKLKKELRIAELIARAREEEKNIQKEKNGFDIS